MLINIFATKMSKTSEELYDQFIHTLEVENEETANQLITKLNETIGRLKHLHYYYNEVNILQVHELMKEVTKPFVVHMVLVSNYKDLSYITVKDDDIPSEQGEFQNINFANYAGPVKIFKFWLTLDKISNMSKQDVIDYGLKLIGDRMPEGFEYREF